MHTVTWLEVSAHGGGVHKNLPARNMRWRTWYFEFLSNIISSYISNCSISTVAPPVPRWGELNRSTKALGGSLVAWEIKRRDKRSRVPRLVSVCEKIRDWFFGTQEIKLIIFRLWKKQELFWIYPKFSVGISQIDIPVSHDRLPACQEYFLNRSHMYATRSIRCRCQPWAVISHDTLCYASKHVNINQIGRPRQRGEQLRTTPLEVGALQNISPVYADVSPRPTLQPSSKKLCRRYSSTYERLREVFQHIW